VVCTHRVDSKSRRCLPNRSKAKQVVLTEETSPACQDVPNADVHVLDAGHFALDTAADEIAALVRAFVTASR
jgi:hypothetical protein